MDFLDIFFPISCLECGKEGHYLCETCLSKVGKARLFCPECHKSSIDGATHAKCRKKRSIDFAFAPWDYSGVVRKAILKLKYNFAYKIADDLANKFVEKVGRDVPILPKDAILIPVPLYKLRQNWRGFNQAEELGKVIAGKMKWSYETNALIRNKKTIPQTDLKGKERSTNLLDAFSLSPNYHLVSTTYILFDDVLTTGSTLKEACKVLKRNGAKVVWGLTIAA